MRIRRPTFHHNDEAGIVLTGTDNTVVDSRADRNGFDGVAANEADARLVGVTANNNGADGFALGSVLSIL